MWQRRAHLLARVAERDGLVGVGVAQLLRRLAVHGRAASGEASRTSGGDEFAAARMLLAVVQVRLLREGGWRAATAALRSVVRTRSVARHCKQNIT